MNEDIMVSVCCTVYNHEKYLRQCLDGFVMQKTDFPFEVIVHDDASTDHSADIIREYEEKYPGIIKSIYQKENQYSQNIPIIKTFMYPKMQGKYIAFCEGDDFWTDPLKLQKQVEAMESHPMCSMCVGKVGVISEAGDKDLGEIPPANIESGIILSDCFIKYVLCDTLFQTSTYFFRSEQYKGLLENPPIFKQICPVGDRAYELYFGTLGDVYYFSEKMSCYRSGSIGSWSQRIWESNENRKKHYQKMNETYRAFDKYSNYKYHSLCNRKVFNITYSFLADSPEVFKELLRFEGRLFRKQSLRRKVRIILGAYFPCLFNLYYKLSKQDYLCQNDK